MVHLKLTGDHPPEIQEVAVMRDASGRKTVCCTAEFPQGTVALTVSVPPGGMSDPLSLGGLLAERLHSAVPYEALRRDLRELVRSLE
jgi:hypothetical protein